MIGLTLTVTVSNVRTSIENSMEVASPCPDLPGSAAQWRAQHCDGHQRFPGSGPDNDIALFRN